MVAIKGIMIDCLDDGPTHEKGGYIFYSGFKYGSSSTSTTTKSTSSSSSSSTSTSSPSTNVTKRIKVNQFFFVRISRHDDPCIGELVSIWKDKYRDTILASVRLYFLPEQTPDGRQSYHGQHEVLAASEPVILRLNDLVSWITEEVDWVIGLEVPLHATHIDPPAFTLPFLNLINDANKQQIPLGYDNSNPQQNQHPNNNQQSSNQHDIGKNMDTINVQDKVNKQLSGDQQQSTSSSSTATAATLFTSSSSQINNNNNSLIGVIDSQIGSQSVIVVLSYPQYCRYRALLKKMEENLKEKENLSSSVNCQSTLNHHQHLPVDNKETKSDPKSSPVVQSVDPIILLPCIRILFCRETFEHEGLLHHDLNCEHLAPKLKGRPRKRGANHHPNNNHHHASSAANNKTTTTTTTTATSNHSSSSAHDSDTSEENKDSSRVRLPRKSSANTNNKVKSSSSSIEVDCALQGNNTNNSTTTSTTTKHTKSKPPAMSLKLAEKCLKNESEFMKQLNKFMKERNTPITRIPHLGFKKIDLFYLFTFTQKLGGYEKITQNKEWKKVYDELGGDPRSTSAATCTRRHFERLLLPFENHLAEARGLVVTRRSTRGRSLSPILPAGSPANNTKGKTDGDDDYQSVGSVNSTERQSHRRSHHNRRRRQGVRQSKRLKGVASGSGIGNSVTTVGSAHGSNASTTATDDDECYSPMSNEDDTIKEEGVGNLDEDENGCNINSKQQSAELKVDRSPRSSSVKETRGRRGRPVTASKLSGGEEETHSMSSSSSKSHEEGNGANDKNTTTTNKSIDNASDSMTEEEDDDKEEEDEEDEDGEGVDDNEDDDDEGGEGGRRKRKRRKGKSFKVKCKSRSPSVENNLNSSNVKRSQLERKFVVKIDGLSTGDPKIRNEEEIMSEGAGVTIKGSSSSSPTPTTMVLPKIESMEVDNDNEKSDSNINSLITKEIDNSGDNLSMSTVCDKAENDLKSVKLLVNLKKEGDQLITTVTGSGGDKLTQPLKSEVKPFNNKKESTNSELSYTDNETNDLKLSPITCNNETVDNNNLTTGTNNCEKVNSTLSKSDKIATINANQNDNNNQGNVNNNNNIVASPLSSISTLISAMDAAKQQQQVHLTREMKLDPTLTATTANTTISNTTINNNDHQSTVNMVGQTNVNIVQANVNNGSGSGVSTEVSGGNNNVGVKKSHHVKNNATVFQNINSSRSSSTSSSGSSSSSSSSTLPSSGRPSVIQKTPLKPCVKVVPTYKDNPIDGLLKDNSLLKKITLPPIAHAASFLSSSSSSSPSSLSSPTWFSQPFTTESSSTLLTSSMGSSSSLVNNKTKNTNSNNLLSLKRKLAPTSSSSSINCNEDSPDLIPLDLTYKKRLIEMDSHQHLRKVVTPKGKVPALVKVVDDDNCPPATILDLSSKIRVKESLSSLSSSKTCSPGNNLNNSLPLLPQLTNSKTDNNNNTNSIHRPSSHHQQQQQQQQQQLNQNLNANVDVNLIPVPKVPKSNANNNNSNERAKSNSSKSGNHNHHNQQQQPPPSRHHINQSPLPVSSPVPVSGLMGILPPSTPTVTPAGGPISNSKPHHSSSTNKHQQQNLSNQHPSSNRSQMVKPSPSPNANNNSNALKVKESKLNHLSSSSVNHPGFGHKDLNQQLLKQTHLNDVNGLTNHQQSSQPQHHSQHHHQRRQQQQQQQQKSQQPPTSHHQQQHPHHQQQQQQHQQLPLQLPAIPFTSSDNHRDIQSKLQSANTLNQLRAMVTPENFALAQQTIAQEIALREMERLHPNLAKQMSQMSNAAAAAAVLGYPTNFHPMFGMSNHRSTLPSSSPSISEYNPTLPSFLPFLNSFAPHSGGNGAGGNGTPGLQQQQQHHQHGILNPNGNAATANANANSAVAAAAAALASGHFFNPAALAAAGQAGFLPLELLGGGGIGGGDERFSVAAAAAAAAAAAENDARWRGWFE